MTPKVKGLSDEKLRFFRSAPEVLPLNDISSVDRNVGTLSAVHWHLPTQTMEYASTRAVCILAGPRVARGRRLDRVNLVDVAPTLAHCLGIDPPAQCEGRVIREAFVCGNGKTPRRRTKPSSRRRGRRG
jgi:arylsulfatase A-like enzyme